MKVSPGKTALILTGGGARAAYQVGVLAAISELLPDKRHNPFPIICGTSAGAINAAALACCAQDFDKGVRYLQDVWRNFHASDVYRADALGIGASGLNWLSAFMFGWLFKHSPRSLLDNTPLRHLLERSLDFGNIDAAIDSGALYAVSITASGYFSGHSVSFFQAAQEAETWKRTHRAGARTRLGVDHLLASSAIPFLFPAIKIHREYFGDGSMRQLAPVSPAIHLGAERILVIGVRNETIDPLPGPGELVPYPSFGKIAGYVLDALFMDGLSSDLESLTRINLILEKLPGRVLQGEFGLLHHTDALIMLPSRDIREVAGRHVAEMPKPFRMLMRGVGATKHSGSQLLSYLLFESGYTRELIQLGYDDAMARQAELISFMEGEPVQAPGGISGWRYLSDEYSKRLRVLKIDEAALAAAR